MDNKFPLCISEQRISPESSAVMMMIASGAQSVNKSQDTQKGEILWLSVVRFMREL